MNSRTVTSPPQAREPWRSNGNGLAVFVFGIDVEDLGEILDVDPYSVVLAIEAPDGERPFLEAVDTLWQAFDLIQGDESDLGNVEPHRVNEAHHQELVFGNPCIAQRGVV